MAHILVDAHESTRVLLVSWLRSRGHTVTCEDDFYGRGDPYDIVVFDAACSHERFLRGPDARWYLQGVPIRPNGLPVRVLLTDENRTHARDFTTHDPIGWVDIAVDPTNTNGVTLLSAFHQAIQLAYARARAHVVRSRPLRARPNLGGARRRRRALAHGVGPSRPADRRAAEARMDRIAQSSGSRIRDVKWFPGPKGACEHLLRRLRRGSFVAGASCPPCPEDRSSEEFPVAPMGHAPMWAGMERAALRNCVSPAHAVREVELELLLTLVHRGLGIRGGLPTGLDSETSNSSEIVPGFDQLWWWLLEDGTAVAADHPVTLSTHANGSLHSTTGPAIAYADGFKVYALLGRRVSANIIEHPESITVHCVRTAGNAELRRVLRGMYGDERFFADTLAKVVDVDTVPVDALAPGSLSLTRALVEDDEGLRYLVSSDGSTSRVYHMRVPRSCTTCAEAYVALSGRPGIRTILEA